MISKGLPVGVEKSVRRCMFLARMGWFGEEGSGSEQARRVASEMKRAMSSMWPSVSSPSMPFSNQRTSETPSVSRSLVSISARERWGLRFALRRTASVVRSWPLPFTSMAPPSRIMPPSKRGSESEEAILPGMVLSRSHGANFPPQALNSQSDRAMFPMSLCLRKMGP